MISFIEYITEGAVRIYNNIHIAHKHAQQQNKKVIHTAGKAYKLADHSHPSPALIPNPDKDKQIADAQAELKNHEKSEVERMKLPYDKRKMYSKRISSIKNKIRNPVRAVEK